MFQPLNGLSRADQATRTAAHDIFSAGFLVHFAHSSRAAGRADFGELIGLCPSFSLIKDNFDNLGNNIASALHNDCITNANILALDFILTALMFRGT